MASVEKQTQIHCKDAVPRVHFNTDKLDVSQSAFASPAPPPETKATLGNGLNMAIRNKTPTNKIKDTMDRYVNDVRKAEYWVKNPQPGGNEGSYNPKLYHKSGKEFKEVSQETEQALGDLIRDPTRAQKQFRKSRPANLTPRQHHLAIAKK